MNNIIILQIILILIVGIPVLAMLAYFITKAICVAKNEVRSKENNKCPKEEQNSKRKQGHEIRVKVLEDFLLC